MTSIGGGAAASPEPRADETARPDVSGAPVPPPATAATPPAATAPSSAGPGTPSTIILGPQGGAATASTEPNRVTRPVTEAEADRHLKGVLERSGDSQARCTKKQYAGGWVTVCE
jgi:hypothetical protein